MSSAYALAFSSKATFTKERKARESKKEKQERIEKKRIETEKIEKEKLEIMYLSLEELLQIYRTIYPDIQKRFPNININFIKNNYNNKTKLFNINIKKLNYKDYIAYKLLKILLKFKIQENTILKRNKFILNEQYISDEYNKILKNNIVNELRNIYILNLEKTIFKFINFIKDIDDKAFMDNINIKWNMLQHTIKNNTSSKTRSPKTI
jgi:hypothetical protein